MISSKNFVLAIAMITLLIFAGSAIANVDDATSQSYKMKPYKSIAGDDTPSGPRLGPSGAASRQNPIGDTVGVTYYEYQKNGTMGRQIAYTPNFQGSGLEYVHFLWMRGHPTDHSGFRRIYYNSRKITTPSAWVWGHTGNSASANNGGYTTIDVTDAGVAVGFWHAGPGSALYSTRSGIDMMPPSGYFPQALPDVSRWAPGPPNCQGEMSGTNEGDAYIWPVGEFQKLTTGEEILHIVSTESPPVALPDESIQSIIYYRYIDGDLAECPGTSTDTLGLYIDASHTVNATVRSDPAPTSDDVALIWCKPFYEQGDPRNSCDGDGNPAGDLNNFQWVQHDIVYMESTDGGATWGSEVNITDYTEGGTLDPINFVHKAQSEISAVYDSDGDLHIIWLTPDFREDDPCQPLFRGNMWHWDQSSNVISRVLDATSPTGFCSGGIGGGLGAISRINISECDGNMYVSFTRFGTWPRGDNNGDCSANGYANGEFCLTASSDGGITWGPDGTLDEFDTLTTAGSGVPVKLGTYVNLTNTYSDGCVAGACHNENFGSMAKYSSGVLHLFYVSDHDAGSFVHDEGEETENEVLYATYPCFTPEAIFSYSVAPEDQSVIISPTSGTDCTMPTTTSFDVVIVNTGNVEIGYIVSETESWMSITGGTGTVTAGINTVATITVDVGPVANETAEIGNVSVSLTSTEGSDQVDIPVNLLVACKYFPPEYEILSTACWSIGVWNVPRAGVAQRSDLGNMFWFLEEFAPMYDEGIIVTYADDVSQTFFSMFDGSNSKVSFVALDSLILVDDVNYDYAHGEWATPDSAITGVIEWYVPKHPDVCVLIERVEVCNNTDAAITIHLGEGIDWDIPDGEDGSDNQSGVDEDRQMVYQYGPAGSSPYEDYYGGASFCGDIVGAIVLENDTWVYDNSGYVPAEIGNLLATHTGFLASDSVEDLNSVYVIAQDLTLAAEECVVYCKVKASSLTGLSDLQNLIDKGKTWICANIDCPGCEPVSDCVSGDANGSGGVDIDDVVYLINYIFGGGPEPVDHICCGDANGLGGIDIDDVVYLINYIFGGGPAPDPAACC